MNYNYVFLQLTKINSLLEDSKLGEFGVMQHTYRHTGLTEL